MSYTLHQKINAGGMADLWLATKGGADNFKKVLAIKVIRSDMGDRADFTRMFLAEAKILSNMSHANIMPVIDLTTIEHSPAIVMELNVGGDLSQIFHHSFGAGAFIPTPMILHIIWAVANGLHYAHSFKDPLSGQPLQIIHRDISPGNILLAVDGNVRLSDFGIAKASNRGFETTVGQIKGKYAYMSPEQLQNKPLDHRSDLFSLGVVLWEGLAGRFRFESTSDLDMYEKLSQPPNFENLSDLNPDVSKSLNQIVMKCLSPNPDQRYRNAAELARDLQRHMLTEFSSFSHEKLGKFVERSLKNQVEQLQTLIQRSLTQATPRADAIQASTERASSEAPSSKASQTPAKSEPSKPSRPSLEASSDSKASQASARPEQSGDLSAHLEVSSQSQPLPVRDQAEPSTPNPSVQQSATPGPLHISANSAALSTGDDSKKINIVVQMGQNQPIGQNSIRHKGKDLTLTGAASVSLRPKLSVSESRMKPFPQQNRVVFQRTAAVSQSDAKKSSLGLTFFWLVLLSIAMVWAVFNAPLILQLLKTLGAK